MQLITAMNLVDPDAIYESLIELHASLSDRQSHALNCKLMELLSERIANRAVLTEASILASEDETEGVDSPLHLPKLVLLLVNHLGDTGDLDEILARAGALAKAMPNDVSGLHLPSYCGVHR